MVLSEWAKDISFLYLGDNEVSVSKRNEVSKIAEKVWSELLRQFPLWSPTSVKATLTEEGVLQDTEKANIDDIVFAYIQNIEEKSKSPLPIFLDRNANCAIYEAQGLDFIKNSDGLYTFVTRRDIDEFNKDNNLQLYCITKKTYFNPDLLPENLPLSFMQCAEELFLYYLSYVFPTLSEKFRELRYSKYYSLLQQTISLYSLQQQSDRMPFVQDDIVYNER